MGIYILTLSSPGLLPSLFRLTFSTLFVLESDTSYSPHPVITGAAKTHMLNTITNIIANVRIFIIILHTTNSPLILPLINTYFLSLFIISQSIKFIPNSYERESLPWKSVILKNKKRLPRFHMKIGAADRC